MDSRRSELQRLKDEEAALEAEHEKNKNDLLTLSKNLQETQLQICQVCNLKVRWSIIDSVNKSLCHFDYFIRSKQW